MKKLLLSGVLAVGLGFPGIARADSRWDWGGWRGLEIQTEMERQQRAVDDLERQQQEIERRMREIEKKAESDRFIRSLSPDPLAPWR